MLWRHTLWGRATLGVPFLGLARHGCRCGEPRNTHNPVPVHACSFFFTTPAGGGGRPARKKSPPFRRTFFLSPLLWHPAVLLLGMGAPLPAAGVLFREHNLCSGRQLSAASSSSKTSNGESIDKSE